MLEGGKMKQIKYLLIVGMLLMVTGCGEKNKEGDFIVDEIIT
jgi:hypothetical protein